MADPDRGAPDPAEIPGASPAPTVAPDPAASPDPDPASAGPPGASEPTGDNGNLRAAGRFALISLLSRGLGLVRTVVFGMLLGGSAGSDAFWAAYKLVNFFRSFLGEGAMGSAMMPVMKDLEVAEPGSSKPFAAMCARLTVAACLVILAAGALVLEPVLRVYQPGMSPATLAKAAALTKVMAPYLVLIGLVSVLMTPLEAARRFGTVAAHPLLYNFGVLAGAAALAAGYLSDPPAAFAWGVVLGGVGQAALLLWAAHAIGVPVLRPGPLGLDHPGMREVGRLMVPTLGGVALVRVTGLVDGAFASLVGPGAMSYLQYGSLLSLAAQGIVGVAVARVYFNQMSEAAAAKDDAGFAAALSEGGRLILVIALPVTVAVCAFPEGLARVYLRGNFTAADLAPTAAAVRGYFAALWVGGLFKLLSVAYAARKQQKVTVRSGVAMSLVNVGLDAALYRPYGVGGLAAATSAAIALNVALLLYWSPAAFRPRGWGRTGLRVGVMAGIAAGAAAFVPPAWRGVPLLQPALALGGYAVILLLARGEETRLIRGLFGRRRRRRD